ncbi:MAG: response regulator transcription factor [Bdellovibrionales bacterium]
MEPKRQVLLIEDSPVFVQLVQALVGHEYRLTVAALGEEGIRQAEAQNFDLIILDVMLPDMDGFQICTRLKTNHKTAAVPIVFVSAKNSEDEKVMAFKLGAEDYITKPISPREFQARLRARLRPSPSSESLPKTEIEINGLHLNPSSHRVTLQQDGKTMPIELTSTEFKLLHLFVTRPDRLLTRQMIVAAVWPHDTHVADRTVDSHVSKLRRKLGSKGDWIESVFGEGYRFFPSLQPTKKSAS